MLNENSSNVSIWEYEIDNDYVQETKKYVPRDQLVGMVITKILDLVYEEERLRWKLIYSSKILDGFTPWFHYFLSNLWFIKLVV